MTELGAMQITSGVSVLLTAFVLFWVGIGLWNANGERFLLRLMAGKLAVNLYVAVAVFLQTVFELQRVDDDFVTWHCQWVIRIAPGLSALLFYKFSEEIRPHRKRRAGH